MKKRILSLSIILVMCMTLLPAMPASAATSGTCGDNLTWTLDDEGTLTISGTEYMWDWSDSSDVPWYNSRDSIKSLIIQNGVTAIGANAFSYCLSLTSVTIPNSITSVGKEAFIFCYGLTSVYIDDLSAWCKINFAGASSNPCRASSGNLYIKGELATNIIIPSNVTAIGEYAFCSCSSLTSVTIPNSVILIGNYAFESCLNLVGITIPSSVTSIGANAFSYCLSLTSVDIPNGVTSIGEYAFAQCSSLTRINIPDSIDRISKCMIECSGLREVNIPNSVTSIAESAFNDCVDMTSISIPINVKYIGRAAFYYCTSLKDVYYAGTEVQWKKINIESRNIDLINATIHYNCYSGGNSPDDAYNIYSGDTDTYHLTVYENKNSSESEKDDYILSKGAEIFLGNVKRTTDKDGRVSLPKSVGSYLVTKKGFVPRELTVTQLKKNPKIYLQKDEGTRPIINAVYIDDIDVCGQDYPIGLTSKETVTLNAEVVWKNESASKIYLMQESRRAEFTDNTLTTVLSDNFDVSSTIYIVAVDSNGNSTKKKLKFKADGGAPQALNDYKLSVGNKISGTIPGSVPVIGGSKVGVDIPMLPITITMEDNKFYGTIGLDVAKFSENYSFTENIYGNYQEKYNKSNKYLFDNIKSGLNKSADSWNITKLKKKWKKAMYSSTATLGFETDIMVIGFVEGYIDSDNNINFLDGGFTFNPSYTVKCGSQIWIMPPVYWEASIKGEIEAMLNLYLNDAAKNFTPRGSIGGKVTLKGGVGLGVSGAAGVSGGVEGKLGVNYDMYERQPNYFELTGSIAAYAKIFAGPFTILDKSFPFAKGVIWDYPSTKGKSVSLMSAGDLTDFTLNDYTQYRLIDRSYAQQPSEFVANNPTVQLFSLTPQNKVEKVLKTNIYTNSEPQLADLGGGSLLTVWIDDDTTRNAINRTSLYYSYYNGSTWSEPQAVQNDKTADFSPNLTVIDGTAHLVWVNTKQEFADNASFSEVYSAWEINSARFNASSGKFEGFASITNDAQTDMTPVIFGESNEIYAAWISNSSNEIFNTGKNYSIRTSKMSSGTWSTPSEFANELYMVDSLDGTVQDGALQLAYSADMDGNLEDYTDKEVWLNNKRLTDNQTLDSKVSFSGNKLYWYADGAISEYDISTGEINSALAEGEVLPTDRFEVIANGNSRAIVFANAGESLDNELYAYLYDEAADRWGSAIPLTDLGYNISSYSGIITENGDIKFAINKSEVVGNIESGNPYGQTDLALFTVQPATRLAIDDVTYSADTLVPDSTVEFTVDITNTGERAVPSYAAILEDADGNELTASFVPETILPGETKEITLYYTIGEEFAPHEVEVHINYEGTATEPYTLALTYEDIAIERTGYGIAEDGNVVIYGEVVNRGYGNSGTVTVSLRKNSANNEVIATQVIDNNFQTLENAAFHFEVPFEENQAYYMTIDSDDMQVGNNSDFVVLTEEFEPATLSCHMENRNLQITADELKSDAVILAAEYNLYNRLLRTTLHPVTPAQPNAAQELLDETKKVRVFAWKDIQNMIPAADVVELDV